MKRRVMACAIFAAAVGLLSPTGAHAVPIGTFSWASDCGPFIGACFTVENFSGAEDVSLPTIGQPGQSFSNVVIRLTTDLGSLITLSPTIFGQPAGVVPAGFVAQTTDDLTSFTIVMATLTFDFALPGTITFLDDLGAPIAELLTPDTLATIDFTPPTGVPEPSTLLLVTGGLALLAMKRSRRPTS